MNPHPHSRFFLVLRHARWLYVSYLYGTQYRSSFQTLAVTHRDTRPRYRKLQPQPTLATSNPNHLQNRLNRIQTP
ncbi:MAG TPA: hypothetical protein VGU64_00310 [Terriglobales bacterium]|nr:hypothetical protein [Terriglobales bacterium]